MLERHEEFLRRFDHLFGTQHYCVRCSPISALVPEETQGVALFLYWLVACDINPLDFARAAAKLNGEQDASVMYLVGWFDGCAGTRPNIVEVLRQLE